MKVIIKITTLLQQENYAEARECIEQLDNPQRTIWTGWLTVYQCGLEAGERFCLASLKSDSTNSELWAILGWVYWEQEYPQKALATYQKSLSIEWSLPAYLNAISVACEAGLIAIVQELIDAYENNLQLHDLSTYELHGYLLCKAILARESGKSTEALQLLNSIEVLKPEVFILRGHIFRDEFLYLQSMMAYQEGLDCFPMHPVLLEGFQSVLHHLPSIPKGVHSLMADQPNSLEAFLKVRAYLERTRAELLERDAESPEVQHLSAAIHGRNPPSPPVGYVEELFDDYADRFESHLV